MLERPELSERAVLVHLDLEDSQQREELEEFQDLVRAAGIDPVATITGSRRIPDPKYFIGAGKAHALHEQLHALDAGLVLVNHALSPSQERNLERLARARVLDRTGLILDIFAQRARSFEGKLQVELAQLRHLATRLVRGWSHLERQKGGIGLRGPGETQLETDRRLIRDRIRRLHRRLAKVQKQREHGRRARRKAELPVVSLVGYTNTGKSTLFNVLTGESLYTEDRVFATLDPTIRRVSLDGCDPFVVADTVGFIRHLPHDLVAAFRSTLEETREASLLVHVIDAHEPERGPRVDQVNDVLHQIGAHQVPQLQVCNKIDLTGAEPRVERNAEGRIWRVWVSAATGEGLDALRQALVERLTGERVQGRLRLGPTEGRVRSRLYDAGAVVTEDVIPEGGWDLELNAPHALLQQLQRRDGVLDRIELDPPHRLVDDVAGPYNAQPVVEDDLA